MEQLLERHFKVKGNILSKYKPAGTVLDKLIEGIEVQLWHKAPMEKIFLGKGLTDSIGDFNIEFVIDSPVSYVVDGKITDVFVEAYYRGEKLIEYTS